MYMGTGYTSQDGEAGWPNNSSQRQNEGSLVHSVHASLHMQHFCVSSVMSMMFEVSLGDDYAGSDAPSRYIDLSSRLCLHVECYV